MKNCIRYYLLILLFSNVVSFSQDTSYTAIAPPRVIRIVTPGKAPFLTIQFSVSYDNGLMDLAASDNASFQKDDFIAGRNFGTRHGYGLWLTGKLALHKEGNLRLNVTAAYNRMQSNFIITQSPQGQVGYNVFSAAIGLENNFTPDRPFKPYIGFDIIGSLINGAATLKYPETGMPDSNISILNTFRLGLDINVGFEYALADDYGVNVGMKLTHANLFFKQTKLSPNPATETYLNDAAVNPPIPYSGWKQFFFGSIFVGFNYYFDMKLKK